MTTAASPTPRRWYFSTVDLLTMAAIAVVGGLLSAYVWNAVMNVANPIFAFLGPVGWIGASGFYLITPVLFGLLVCRMGAPTLYGVIQGFCEMLFGNPFGVMSIVYAACEGLGVDLGMAAFRYKPSLMSAMLAGAIGDLIVDEIYIFVFGLQSPFTIIVGGITAIISGAVLGGGIAYLIAIALQRTGVVSRIGLKGYEELK